jgi:hypothetical protein
VDAKKADGKRRTSMISSAGTGVTDTGHPAGRTTISRSS